MPTPDAGHTAHAGEAVAAAFVDAYTQYYPGIFEFARRSTGSAAVAEDLTAEVFARLVDRLKSFQDYGRPLRAWLYIVARNLVVDYRRRQRIRWVPLDERLVAPQEVHPVDRLERDAERAHILAALTYLTEAQRQVIWLKFIEGCSNAETAAIVGRDENAVKSLQHRALASLRRVLGGDQGHARR